MGIHQQNEIKISCQENRENTAVFTHKKEFEKQIELLNKALIASPTCVRASIMLAELAMLELDYSKALKLLEKVLEQNAIFISEILPLLKYLYEELNDAENYELFLIRANQKQRNSQLDLALIDLIEKQSGKLVAQNKLYQQLKINPSPLLFHRFIQYHIDETTEYKQQHSFVLLQKMVTEYMKQSFEYRCHQCGFQSHKLIWCCPSCHQWETILPVEN